MIYKNVNGTQKLVTNIRKPKKWRRFEYLLSSGTLYIDTEYIPTNFTKVILDFKNNVTNDGFFFGGRDKYNGTSCFCLHKDYALFGNDMGSGYSITTSTSRNLIALSLEGIYINNILKHTYTNKTFTSPKTLKLFAMEQSAGMYPTKSSISVYMFKVYDNNTLIRDFIPAQYNGQYGMWDLVENKFYENKGTGTFTVGPEIANYDEVEKVLIPNTLLPSGVELYDYIESTGTLWIDTGVYGYMNHRYELDYLQTGTGSYRMWGVFGQTAWLGYNMSITWSGGRCVRWSSTVNGLNLIDHIDTISNTTRHTFIIDKGLIYYDGVDKGKSTGHSDSCIINYSIYLFTVNPANSTPTGNAVAKIYSYKDIDENGNLVRNMLPCTYFGEPGMWDTVTKLFYRNQGTGQFTLGDKITILLYEYLQNTSGAYIDTTYNLNLGNTFTFTFLDVFNNGVKTTASNENKGYGLGVPGESSSKNYSGGGRINGGTIKMWINSTNTDTGIISSNSFGKYIETLDIKESVVDIKFEDSNGNIYINKTINSAAKNNGILYFYKDSSSSYAYPGIKKLFNATISKDGNLIRDYVPCSYNGTPGLWDKVELKFYGNAGSGNFTLGRLVSGEIPIWVLKNALIGDGNAYINTGVKLDPTKKIRIVTEVTAHPDDGNPVAFFGTNDYLTGIMGIYHYTNNSEYYLYVHGQSHTGNRAFNINAGELIQFDSTIDFPNLSTTGTFQGTQINGTFTLITDTTYPITIFKSQYATKYKGKCYKFQIYLDDILIRNYVPATMGGRPGLYDKVNHKMYFNANSSGNFTVE